MTHVLITNISSKNRVLELQGRFTYEKIQLDRSRDAGNEHRRTE